MYYYSYYCIFLCKWKWKTLWCDQLRVLLTLSANICCRFWTRQLRRSVWRWSRGTASRRRGSATRTRSRSSPPTTSPSSSHRASLSSWWETAGPPSTPSSPDRCVQAPSLFGYFVQDHCFSGLKSTLFFEHIYFSWGYWSVFFNAIWSFLTLLIQRI